MKLNMLVTAVILTAEVCTVSAQAQKAIDSTKQREMMEAAMATMMPGPEHELLTTLAGQWSLEIKAWPAPGKDPVVSTGTAVNEAVIGGRFVKSMSTAEMMGMPFEGLTMLGFDRRSEKYTSVVFDSFGTYYVTAEGSFDSTTQTIIMTGREEEGASGEAHEYDFRLSIIDDNTYTWAIVFKDPTTSSGTGEFKMIETTYTRADN